MTKTLTLLLTATILSSALALPAISAATSGAPALASQDRATPMAETLQLASADHDEDDDDHRGLFGLIWGHDDDDDDDGRGCNAEDDDDDDDDDDHDSRRACAGALNPAPAGTTAPPANGLFSNGAAPVVKVN